MKPEQSHISKQEQAPQPKQQTSHKKKQKVKPVSKRELLQNIQPGT
jgi:hypothetical protein